MRHILAHPILSLRVLVGLCRELRGLSMDAKVDKLKRIQMALAADMLAIDRCSQCGHLFSERACGPSHAIMASQRGV